MQRYAMVFITVNAVHVSGGSPAHHQELKTVYTASVIVEVFLLLTAIVSELELAVFSSWWWAEEPPETYKVFTVINTVV